MVSPWRIVPLILIKENATQVGASQIRGLQRPRMNFLFAGPQTMWCFFGTGMVDEVVAERLHTMNLSSTCLVAVASFPLFLLPKKQRSTASHRALNLFSQGLFLWMLRLRSTLLGLMLRFYDPKGGAVLLNGRPLTDYNLRLYRKSLRS